MPKMDLSLTNEKGETVSRGKLEIKNQSESAADFFIYGDIITDSWGKWCDEDTCPRDVTEFLSGLEDVETINVYINSGGGSVFAGIAIYQQLKRSKAKKNVHIDGIGASIASVIAMAGDKIIMPEGSMLMIHKPMNGYFLEMKNADELRKDADTLDRIQDSLLDIYMGKAKDGVAREEIEDAINQETWMNAEQAERFFDVVSERSRAAAAADSDFYGRYRNTPKDVKKADIENNAIDAEQLASTICEAVSARMESFFEKEQETKTLLQDLERYGK